MGHGVVNSKGGCQSNVRELAYTVPLAVWVKKQAWQEFAIFLQTVPTEEILGACVFSFAPKFCQNGFFNLKSYIFG